MGLDMYLEAERFFWFNEEAPVVEGQKIKKAVAEAGYWRKANHIHNWFVENVQGGVDECERHYVSREQLNELGLTCQKVKETPALAEELLPAKAGFFFGSTDYDEYYFAQIDETLKIIDRCLDPETFPETNWTFYYHSSW